METLLLLTKLLTINHHYIGIDRVLSCYNYFYMSSIRVLLIVLMTSLIVQIMNTDGIAEIKQYARYATDFIWLYDSFVTVAIECAVNSD